MATALCIEYCRVKPLIDVRWLGKVLAEGGSKMTSFIALFGITQSLGSLIGIAFVQTSVLYRQQYHMQSLAAQLARDNPLVSNEIARFSHQLLSTLQDPTLRAAEGVSALSQQALIEAQVSAYGDVFSIIFVLAALVALFLLGVILHDWLTKPASEKVPQ
jgi:hypothetical protein